MRQRAFSDVAEVAAVSAFELLTMSALVPAE
jgi:hypothetical protein